VADVPSFLPSQGVIYFEEGCQMQRDAPNKKRVVAFFDCQNLFKAVKHIWGYSFPNFDPVKLAQVMTEKHKYEHWKLEGIRLYSGIHDKKRNPEWYSFWTRKLANHKNKDTRVSYFTSPLRYSEDIPREKGVDIRIALDLVRMARKNEYDVALLFSQDNDFAEVAQEIRDIANEYSRWIKIASAYPCDLRSNTHGVDRTDWVPISREEYDACIDPLDYRTQAKI
jgi:hypothetical protein